MDDHVGLFQRAHGGTVFLDEIGETSPAFQVKLLRVLQEGELARWRSTAHAGGRARDRRHAPRPGTDVRAGRFREDLYYRIAGVTLAMPPLRGERGSDDIVPSPSASWSTPAFWRIAGCASTTMRAPCW